MISRHRARLSTLVTLAAALAVTLAGCGPGGLPTAGQSAPGASVPAGPVAGQPGRPVTPQSARAALAVLATIPVRPIPGRDGSYRRDAFGDPWSDSATGVADAGNGCDTRDDILKRDAKPGTVRFKPGSACTVAAGQWISPYTGATIPLPRRVDIDHIVPLGRAWAAGAKSWPAQRRLAFANDPDNLLAVDASSNRSKGDLGPSTWRPLAPYQCAYAVGYVRSTKKWALPLSPADVAALKAMLASCPH